MTDLTALDAVLKSSAFNPLDRHFSRLMLRISGKECPALGLAAALASRQLADGHSCVSLGEHAGRAYPDGKGSEAPSVACPPRAEWEKLLRGTAVVGAPGEGKPLILDAAGRLYLNRYWRYEQAIAQDLLARSELPPLALDEQALAAGLDRLFPAAPDVVNWQKVAAFTAVRRRFCVVTGGPGTGKTWTVARLLALLMEQPGGGNLKLKLAAPTGKAAARLQESLRQALKSLDCSESAKARLQEPDLTTTIHRLLGPIPNSVGFRHGKENPLNVDVLVVDEASMVSLSIMARLLDALRQDNVRLILVGDKDQLPAVDPGGVLGDICRAASINRFSARFRQEYQACKGGPLPETDEPSQRGLADLVVQLQVNHRSGEAVALHSLATLVNAGSHSKVLDSLQAAQSAGSAVSWQTLPVRHQLKTALRSAVLQYYLPVLQSPGPEEALKAFGRFRILCAVREGPYGMMRINDLVEEILAEELPNLALRIGFGSYRGKPVMVTANNYTVKRYNGDIGVFWPAAGGASLAHFPEEDGSVRGIARERLPGHETVYAMTVHKSQGSEFEHVVLVLPEKENPVLTRELLYTGLTRAKKSVQILAHQEVLRLAIRRQAQRQSGLSDALCSRTASQP